MIENVAFLKRPCSVDLIYLFTNYQITFVSCRKFLAGFLCCQTLYTKELFPSPSHVIEIYDKKNILLRKVFILNYK